MKEIFLYGEIGYEIDAATVADQFQVAREDPVTLRIHSGGGSVFDGVAIANAIRQHPHPVTAQVDGVALSMAANIALEADTLRMSEDGWMMFHEAHTGLRGGADELRRSLGIIEQINASTTKRLAERLNADPEQVAAALKNEIWHTGADWHQAGVVHELMPAAAVAAAWQGSIGIDDFEQTGMDSAMKASLKQFLEKVGVKAEPEPEPEAPENVVALNDLKAELELSHEAIQYLRQENERLQGQLKDAHDVALRRAYEKLAGAGHEAVDVADAKEKDDSLEAQYKELSRRVEAGERGAAQERRAFRNKYRKQLLTN